MNIRAEGFYYRDRQDNLWMDPELLPDGNWMLYRSGSTGPRVYSSDGKCLWEEGAKARSVGTRDDLVVEIPKVVEE